MENIKTIEITKEIERALDFMEKHSREAKLGTDIKRADMYEIFDDIFDAEKKVIDIRQESYEKGEHINAICEKPETNVLLSIFNSILVRDLSEYGVFGVSIFADIPALASQLIEAFLPELENLDELTRCAFNFQALDLLDYVTRQVNNVYITFCKLEKITGLDKEEDFQELNELAKKIDDYTLFGEGENPLKNYRGKDATTDAFIELLDIMAQM